jgi:hypothetical protein
MINLRNYVNLSPVAIPAKKIEELDFGPLGGGSGMIGLPFLSCRDKSTTSEIPITGTEIGYSEPVGE